jgi:hypothetical protein
METHCSNPDDYQELQAELKPQFDYQNASQLDDFNPKANAASDLSEPQEGLFSDPKVCEIKGPHNADHPAPLPNPDNANNPPIVPEIEG